jgi:MFS family permease
MKGNKTTCGFLGWRPKWIQKLATRQVYAAVYSILGIVQGMGFSYLSSVLSTIEKMFGIKSKETAWVFSGNEINQICFIFVLPFLGRIKKRALWTSIAMLLTSLGLFLCASPFFVKDKSLYEGGWNSHNSGDICEEHSGGQVEDCSTKVRDFWGMAIIFLGFFITGIGSSFFYSFGIPYIDDNVSKDSSPAVLGLVLGSRTLGPGLG